MDENYYRPDPEQLKRITPKIESETTTNADNYVSVELTNPRIDALEKRITELENDIKEIHTAFKNIYNTLQDYIKQH